MTDKSKYLERAIPAFWRQLTRGGVVIDGHNMSLHTKAHPTLTHQPNRVFLTDNGKTKTNTD